MRMEIMPYSIYYKHRPIRVAFLIDKNGNEEWLDVIFEYNNKKWGGRFNAIFLTDGNIITDEWWQFLKNFDPDIIKSTVPLSENLQKRIHIFLTPLSVELPEDNAGLGRYVNLKNDPIDILPTKDNIRIIARDILDDCSSLVLFEVDDTTPGIIKKFLTRNFGFVKSSELIPSILQRTLDECNLKTYKITDYTSLNDALLNLGNFRNRVIFPIQICSLPNQFQQSKYSQDGEWFTVVTGDSIHDIVYFWNRIHFLQSWMRTSLTQLWLPTELANEQSLHEGLEKFLNRYAGQTGNNHGINFVSYSVSEDDLKKLSVSFKSIWHPKRANSFTDVQIPGYDDIPPFHFLQNDVRFFRANSNEEHIILDEPKVKEGGMGGQYWFTDLYIQFKPERFTNIIGIDYWWQLPRRNNILYESNFFNKPARINKHGSFSLLINRSHEFNRGSNIIKIKIPEDRSIFYSLLCGESFDCYQKDDKAEFLSRPYHYAQRSDQGKYLTGVLSLFSNLLDAHNIFEERFWRKMFKKMANQNDDQTEKQKLQILQGLKKSIDRGRDFNNNREDLDWLASKVLILSRNYSKEEIDLKFSQIKSEAIKETEEYNAKKTSNNISFDERDLVQKITELLEYDIFSLGIKPSCPLCGYKIWYSLNDAKQKIKCRGCGYDYNVRSNEIWHYRLNSLVRKAISVHGTIPVLLVLGQLMHDARSSFMYYSSTVVLNKEGGSYVKEAEIDLLCIVDGEFIIGEIKQSASLFDKNDFEKMEKVAKLVRPDRIIFSALDGKPSSSVLANIEKMKQDLSYLGIKVEWYSIYYWTLQAAPVR